jgi:hypothetical protein
MKSFCFIILALAFLGTLTTSALACGLEGRATRGKSNVDGTVRVSTSWNGKEAFPRGGSYSLELGDSACGESVEVFVDGKSIGRRSIPKRGMARVDISVK